MAKETFDKGKKAGAEGGQQPLAPADFLGEFGLIKPVFSDVTVQDTHQQGKFNRGEFEYVDNPSVQDIGTERLQAARQPISDVIGRSLKQFGANVVGAIATSAFNTADVQETFNVLSNKENEFNTTVFGVSTKDIMDWTQDVAKNNAIYEEKPGSTSPSDLAWWGQQFASAGTGVGMALYSLGETAAVSAATEGLGTIPEILSQVKKIPQLARLMRSARTAEQAVEIADMAAKLRRTATTYAIMNRLNESKMEAQQTFHESYDELRAMKNPDGSQRYTDEEARDAAAAGARRDFAWNMPLMALDILSYRTMVFNPFNGAGEGLIEKGLSKVASKIGKNAVGRFAGRALPMVVGSAGEGLEEGLQYVGSNEGKHYARVMAGLDDLTTFGERLGADVKSDEFWNNFAGGVIGSPIIGGTMKLFNKAMNGRSQRQLSQLHNDFVSNIGRMDTAIGQLIRDAENSGDAELAKVYRRNFGANKALSAMYLDGMKGSQAGMDAYRNFLTQTLQEVNEGKLDSLQDLGFTNPTESQVEQIKSEFQTYINDSNRIEALFNQVSNQHERQFVAPIVQQMFSLETRREKQQELETSLNTLKQSVFGYSSLTENGQKLHDINYQLLALNNEKRRLQRVRATTVNPLERDNVDAVISSVEQQMTDLKGRVSAINVDQSYTQAQKISDSTIVAAPLTDERYYQTIRDMVANASQIDLEGRDLALWNNKQYKDEQSILGVINSRTKEQLQMLEEDLKGKGTMTDTLQEAINNKRAALLTQEAKDQVQGRANDVAEPVVTNPTVEQAQQENPEAAVPVPTPPVSAEVQGQQQAETLDPNAPSVDATNTTVPTESGTNIPGVPGNSDLFSDAMNDIMDIEAELSAEITTVPVAPTDISQLNAAQMRQLPSDNQQTIDDGMVIIDSIDYDDQNSINDGIGKLLQLVNNKFIPVKQYVQVLKQKQKLIGNDEYFTHDYLEKYLLYTFKDFSENALKAITYPVGNNLKVGDIELSKMTIPNLAPILSQENFMNKLQVIYNGQPAIDSGVTVTVNDNNRTAEMFHIETRPNVSESMVVVAAVKLGMELANAGYTLESRNQGSQNAKSVWATLTKLGYAQGAKGVYQFAAPNINDDPSDDITDLIEASFAPAAIRDTMTDAQRDKLRSAVQVLLQDINNPSFEDLIRRAIKQSNVDTAEKSFNLLTKGWEAAGYSPVDYRATYMKVFQDPMGTISSLLGELALPNEDSAEQNEKQVEHATEAAVEDSVNQQNLPTDFDNNGQPIYNYTGVVTEESNKKFAFLSVPYTLLKTVNPDGSITITKESIPGELNQGDYVDSLKLLDPDKYTEGTEMQVMVPSNFMDIKVSVTNDDGTFGTAMPFGQYVAEKNLTPDMQEYKDKIPMIIYDKGQTNQKGVAFVHDVQWYNPVNFVQSKPGEMEAAIDSTREMRQAVLDSARPVAITITSKRETTFEGLKLPQGTKISLKEANPETTITVAKNIQELTVDGKNIVFDGELMNVKPFSPNMAYDVRQTGRRDGKPVYTAFPISQPQISDLTKESINMALKVFVNAKNNGLPAGDKSMFDKVHAQILSSSGIDIRTVNGINQYLKQFIHVFDGNNVGGVADAEAQLRALGKKDGYKYLTINSAGGITFGILGTPITPKNNGFFVNPNPGVDAAKSFAMANGFLANLDKYDFLNGYQQHVHFASMNANRGVVQVTKLGVPTVTPSYKEHLLNTLQTNIKSVNIGTDASPKYVTNVQPIITYEMTSKLRPQQNPTIDEVAQEATQESEVDQQAAEIIQEVETAPQVIDDKTEKLRAMQQELIAQAREELGLDFINPDDLSDNNFYPAELTEEQRDLIADSIDSIAGLNPQQQYELIDFMYNQVASAIEVGNKEAVSRNEVYQKVKQSFESIIKPLRNTYKEKAEKLRVMIKVDPNSPYIKDLQAALTSYTRSIDRIDDIQANYKLMEKETAKWVEKYTNIERGHLQDNLEKDEDSVEDSSNDLDPGDGSAERNKEFGTDTLSENPDSKLTYAMRRFLGQIRQVGKDGQPATGFLKLPVYVGSDTVASTVRDLLSDVPSNFDVMMAKLETHVPAHPWLRELIDRLTASNNERKNQFVTVMSNHRLSMKFSMLSYDRKTNNWTTKVYDTFQSGLANQLAVHWKSGFIDSKLVTMVNEVYTLNTEEAQRMVSEFESWMGADAEMVQSPLDSVMPQVQRLTNKMVFNYIEPTGELKAELDAKLTSEGKRMKFKSKGIDYQVEKIADKYIVKFFNKNQSIEKSKAKQWLADMGITMSEAGFEELMTKGLYHNYTRVKGDALFTSGDGLFRILYLSLKKGIFAINKDLTTGEGNPFNESVIKSLANLESNFNTSVNSPNGRDGGKSIFGFTAPKFITDRTRDLKTQDGKVIQQLASTSFSKKSLWLDLLINSDKFRDNFQVSHIGLTAMKELGKKVYKDNSITKLSDVDHELTKLAMFWDSRQGDVAFNNRKNTFGDTTIPMRMATMFVPTMSDKSNMMLLKTAVLNLEEKHFDLRADGMPTLGKEAKKALYEQAVRPELLRMVKHAQIGGKTNISAYDKGAKMFLLVPEVNNVMLTDELRLVDAISNGVDQFNTEFIESRPDLMDKIYDAIDKTFNSLVDGKMLAWDTAGFFTKNQQGAITEFKFIDKTYAAKYTGTPHVRAMKAAIDFELNSMMATANSFMLYAGDPAIYYKSKSKDYMTAVQDTFVNVGKRLANQIAPGTTIANSEDERYIQIFLDDRKSLPEIPFLKFATRVNDGKEITNEEIAILQGNDKAAKDAIKDKYPKSAGYFEIEGSDAQEYTTWREHLSLLERLGKTSDGIFEVSPTEIQEARELFNTFENGRRAALTPKQEKLIGKVLQPMKPVYTGQIFDAEQDVMRTMYIKSSSFPLIPQLTAGLEIDKLRVAMEDLQDKQGMNVRASYQTANKVGSVTNPVKLWNADGTLNAAGITRAALTPKQLSQEEGADRSEFLGTSSLVLERKNFRIQQDVPFKSGKKLEDKITLGTQLMKILFGNGVINGTGFKLGGRDYTGMELHRMYNDAFENLIATKKMQLFDELGLDADGNPINPTESTKKLQRILKEEAEGRNYPIQDIEGLDLDEDGNFIVPLWSSANSNRYEAMLNAIVTNRIIKIKFPGNSYVVGSEEGFKFQENMEGVDQSKIVWTSSWNGQGLQGSFKQDGSIKKAQVLAASKFRDREGRMIDLLAKKDGQYIYVTRTEDGRYLLKEDMFDKDLLSLTSFRIPTSGHVSAAQVEIVGFLPAQNADLMIVPRNFTKQMGLDFDVDKQNTYQLWHIQNPETYKFEALGESHRQSLLNAAMPVKLDDGTAEGNLLRAIFGDEIPEFTEEEIKGDAKLKAINAKISEKLLQNKIIQIHASVLTHNDDSTQSKINGILSTDYAEEQANIIERLVTARDTKVNTVFSPLSSEYQKMKMGLGAAGKVGTGAYSLDVVFHSLTQQSRSLGKPLRLTEVLMDEEGRQYVEAKKFRFGKQVSTGELGGEMTIDGDRSIAEVLAELQNVALDNEKLQVMGRVDLNDLTIDVSKVFALLGFDKGDDKAKSSVQFLFLSQPIIRDFVAEMKNASSNMAEYNEDKEQTIIHKLVTKYNPNDATEKDAAYWESMSDRMNTTEMLTALASETPDGQLQEAILYRFMEMKQYGVAIKSVQTGINADAKGLGKSFFDVIERRNALNKIGGFNGMIENVSSLIGDYVPVDEYEGLADKTGYMYIGNYYVKPTTLTGSFNIHAVSAAYNLWSKHLPYNTDIINKVYDEVSAVIGATAVSDALVDNKSVILKQDIFKAMKKFFSANNQNGIVSRTDDVSAERQRLFIDSDTHTSLAKYVRTLRETEGNRVINNFIKTNKLINRFEFDIQKNGTPSLIKFNNAVGEEFDEEYLYNSLSTLLANNQPLPEFNGRAYNTSMLAQDLIAYTYLANATQEAIQFTKYIPITYSKMVGYSQFMRDVSTRLEYDGTVLGARMSNPEGYSMDSDFTIQFVQHNPERVNYKLRDKKFRSSIINANNGQAFKDINEIQSFSLKLEEGQTPPRYISVYNSSITKGEKKFQLYMHLGDNQFRRIPVLGTFGMDEYNPARSIADSIVNGKVKVMAKAKKNIQPAPSSDATDIYNMASGNGKTVLDNIANANIAGLSEVARMLAPFASNIKVKQADMVTYGWADNTGVTIKTGLAAEAGNTKAAVVIVHEMVHALTRNQIAPYIDSLPDGSVNVKGNAPTYVTNMVQLFNVTRKVVGQEKIDAVRTKINAQKQLNNDLRNATTPEERQAILAKMSVYGFTDEEMSVNYGAYDIFEFMAMALTEPGFQTELSKHQFKGTGKSLLTRFKEILNSILNSLGLNFDENSVAAQSINSIFEFITDKNVSVENNEVPDTDLFNEIGSQGFDSFDNTISEDDAALFSQLEEQGYFDESDLGDPDEGGDIETSFLPAVPNTNENNCY